jgi:hypothetical protein
MPIMMLTFCLSAGMVVAAFAGVWAWMEVVAATSAKITAERRTTFIGYHS